MRKRVILYANGWGTECLLEIGHGLQKVAYVNDIDIFAFINYAAYKDTETNKLGDFNVFTLPDINDFDGAVILANSFNTEIETSYVTEQIIKSGIPAISVESRIEGADFFGTDDYKGMCEVAEHLICDHGIKDILYIGGIKGHEGDAIRCKAVVDTAKKHGIEIPSDNIIHGYFAAFNAIEALTEWRKEHTLPEAIICANDIMAIGVCDYLKEEGLSIPQDIKVTGFDCLKSAGEYEPSITSVNRDWLSMGIKIMDKLILKMNGQEVEREEQIESKMIVGGSCGCEMDESNLMTWKTLREKQKDRDVNGFRVDQHFRHMFLSMRKVVTIDDMCNSFSDYMLEENWYEGSNIMLGLCPGFFIYTDDESEKTITMGYPDVMDAACLICGGKKLSHRRSNTSNLIFEASNRNQTPGVYLFAPLRCDTEMFGFIMVSDGFSIVQNDLFYIWTKHMGQYLEQVKSNAAIDQLTKRLEMLSVTDKLTNVYNRTGCEAVIYTKLIDCQAKGGRSVVMLGDIDRLKKINDTFGHSAGDEAIKTTISLLKANLPSEYMIGRFGGDEFLIAAPLYEEIDVDALAENIMNKIAKDPMTKEFTFELGFSIGGIQLPEGKNFSIQECLPQLDKKMYRIKEEHHAKSDF